MTILGNALLQEFFSTKKMCRFSFYLLAGACEGILNDFFKNSLSYSVEILSYLVE